MGAALFSPPLHHVISLQVNCIHECSRLGMPNEVQVTSGRVWPGSQTTGQRRAVTVEQMRAIRQVVSIHKLNGNVVGAHALTDMIFPRVGGHPRNRKMGKDSPAYGPCRCNALDSGGLVSAASSEWGQVGNLAGGKRRVAYRHAACKTVGIATWITSWTAS